MKDFEESHRTLMLLEEISRGDAVTQRDLSDRVGIALGLVNAYLKNLVIKGQIKISGIPKRRYRYYLTPKGFAEKSRLTYSLLQNYTRIFREARHEYSVLFQKLRTAGVNKVYFAGVDELAEIAYLSLREADIELLGAVDDGCAGSDFFRTKVLSFSELDTAPSPHVVITAYGSRGQVRERLLAAGVPAGHLHSIYPL